MTTAAMCAMCWLDWEVQMMGLNQMLPMSVFAAQPWPTPAWPHPPCERHRDVAQHRLDGAAVTAKAIADALDLERGIHR